MSSLLLTLTSTALLGLTVLWLRASQARRQHAEHQCYRLRFPGDLPAQAVQDFLTSLSGLLAPWWQRWLVQPVVSLEIRARKGMIEHYLRIPKCYVEIVESGLIAHLPSVRFEAVADEAISVRLAREYRITTNQRMLRAEPPSLNAGTLASLQPLKYKEEVVVQWLLSAAAPVKPARLSRPEDSPTAPLTSELPSNNEAVTALRTKQQNALLLASLRVGVSASTNSRARALLQRVEVPWRASRAPGVQLLGRSLPSLLVVRRLRRHLLPLLRWPMLLNAVEASGLIGWPVAVQPLPGLTLGGCRLLPVPQAVAETGTRLGVSTFPGSRGRAVTLDVEARMRPTWICGPTGSGKSTLICNMALQDIANGHSVIVLDPKGDLVTRIAERIPEHRLQDVLILDGADDAQPLGYNPLRCTPDNRELVVENVVGVMHAIWQSSWGPRSDDLARGVLLTLTAVPDMTLCEIVPLLTDEDFRSRILESIDDPYGVEGFWRTFNAWRDNDRLTAIAPILNKTRALTMRSRLRGMLGQSTGAVDLPWIVANRQVLLVDLSAGRLGTEMAYLLGALLFAGIWDAVSARAGLPDEQRPEVFCYLDEFQHLIALPTPAETVLSEARSFRLSLTVAHQAIGQLSDSLQQAVRANARSKVVFQTGQQDAAVFARELGGGLTPADLMGIAAHEAVVAAFAAGTTQPPCTIALPPLPPLVRPATELTQLSRERWGVPRRAVDDELKRRQTPKSVSQGPVGRTRRPRP